MNVCYNAFQTLVMESRPSSYIFSPEIVVFHSKALHASHLTVNDVYRNFVL